MRARCRRSPGADRPRPRAGSVRPQNGSPRPTRLAAAPGSAGTLQRTGTPVAPPDRALPAHQHWSGRFTLLHWRTSAGVLALGTAPLQSAGLLCCDARCRNAQGRSPRRAAPPALSATPPAIPRGGAGGARGARRGAGQGSCRRAPGPAGDQAGGRAGGISTGSVGGISTGSCSEGTVVREPQGAKARRARQRAAMGGGEASAQRDGAGAGRGRRVWAGVQLARRPRPPGPLLPAGPRATLPASPAVTRRPPGCSHRSPSSTCHTRP